MKISAITAVTFFILAIPNAFAGKSTPLCDKFALSAMCTQARFSPAPNPELTATFHRLVDAAQADYVASTGDYIDGSVNNGPACNWRETSDRYGYVLHCTYKTISGKTCSLFSYPDYTVRPTVMHCLGAKKH